MYIMNEIKQMRRENLSKDEKRRLIRDDQREERELRSYVVSALTTEIERLLPSSAGRNLGGSGKPGGSGGSSSEVKLPARQTGTETWRRARGENGTSGPRDPDQPHREGQ